jgi:hypothetical protein
LCEERRRCVTGRRNHSGDQSTRTKLSAIYQYWPPLPASAFVVCALRTECGPQCSMLATLRPSHTLSADMMKRVLTSHRAYCGPAANWLVEGLLRSSSLRPLHELVAKRALNNHIRSQHARPGRPLAAGLQYGLCVASWWSTGTWPSSGVTTQRCLEWQVDLSAHCAANGGAYAVWRRSDPTTVGPATLRTERVLHRPCTAAERPIAE